MNLIEIISRKKADEELIYREIQGLNLPMHFYYPSFHNPSLLDTKAAPLKPAIVLIHGGGWGGRKDNSNWNGDFMNSLARYFAMRGVVGVTFSYRNVYNPQQNEKEFEEGPELLDLYEDCLVALRFIRHNSAKFGIDPEKIAVLGDSAGGHLAACLGTLEILRTSEDKKPACVVACNPITDLTDSKWFKYVKGSTRYNEFGKLNRLELAKLVSPLHNINSQTSPTLVIHGTADTLVVPEHASAFHQEMKKAGNDCELVLLEGATHAFILPEYYKDKKIIVNSIEIVDKYFAQKGILISRE